MFAKLPGSECAQHDLEGLINALKAHITTKSEFDTALEDLEAVHDFSSRVKLTPQQEDLLIKLQPHRSIGGSNPALDAFLTAVFMIQCAAIAYVLVSLSWMLLPIFGLCLFLSDGEWVTSQLHATVIVKDATAMMY